MFRNLIVTLWIGALTAGASAGDIHVPDPNPAKGSTASIPWGQTEVRYQAYVPSSALGGKKVKFSDLAFAPAVAGTFQAQQLEIRMAHTTQAFGINFNNNLSKNTTTVYSGPILWKFTAGTWNDLGLTAPFAYNGTDHLVIDVRFKGGQGGPRCYAGIIQTYFAVGPGSYNAVQPGNVLLRVAPKMRLHYNETEIIGSGSTAPGGTVDLTLKSPADAGRVYQVGTSLGLGPIPIDTRRLRLSPDAILVASVGGSLPMVFEGYTGRLDATGQGRARLHIPNLPVLKGVRLHSAFLTLDGAAPSGVKNISDPFTFTIQ